MQCLTNYNNITSHYFGVTIYVINVCWSLLVSVVIFCFLSEIANLEYTVFDNCAQKT